MFSMDGAAVDQLRLASRDAQSGATYLGFTQTINGLDVFEGHLRVVLSPKGEVVQASAGELIPGVAVVTRPVLTAAEAEAKARGAVKAGEFIRAPELMIFPLDAATGRLAYRLYFEADPAHTYEILIDARDGSTLYRHNNTVFATAQGRVWKESPLVGTRDLVDFPAWWLPDIPAVTTGNNVDAFLDANGDERPDTTVTPGLRNARAAASAGVFDFPFGDATTSSDPRNYAASSVLNIFYFLNRAHDYFYDLGFDEGAGNFQTDNFGKGGKGGDAVVGLAQSSSSTNNASFTPTPEGTPGRARFGIFTRGTTSRLDDRDAAYDGQIVIHEYTHGVSNRLVGNLTSTSCLARIQSGAMGEGWSDYFAASFFNNPVMGAYIDANPVRGIRRQSYENYTFTYEDIGNDGYEVHDDGEIWAGTLWDVRKTLGQATADRLIMAGLKATPCNPSMTDARDGILGADQATNGGANRAAIWTVFARHGMGFSANGVEGSDFSGHVYDAAFDKPADLQPTRGPAITSKPLTVVAGAGDNYVYTVSASNPGQGTLVYNLAAGPAGMLVDANSGAVSWTGTFTSPRVKIEVTDGKGGRVVHGYMAPMLTRISLGTPVTISGSIYSFGFAYVDVPAGLPVLQVATRGASGDADLAVQDPARVLSYTERDGSNETLSFARPLQGRWLIEVDGFDNYSDVSLLTTAITPSPLAANSAVSGLGGIAGSERFYRVSVPAQAATLKVTTSGDNGDVDLYLRYGNPAVCQEADSVQEACLFTVRSAGEDSNEALTVQSPAAGDWYIGLTGFGAYSSLTLRTFVTLRQPDLTVTSTHSDGFTQGKKGGAYSLVVANVGSVETLGTVTLVNTLPAGFTATAMEGAGWTCVLGTLSCSRSDVLAAGASFPVVTLTVDIGAGAGVSALNVATVAGGGEANTDNSTAREIALVGNGGPSPTVLTGGVAPVYSSSTTIQAGSWISIYGTNFAAGVTEWAGDFPTTLGGVTVTVNGKPAYIWFVSPTQINVQAPDDSVTGEVDVVVATGNGSATAKVTLGVAGPSFSVLGDGKHAASVIVTPDGSGQYGGGTYDLSGPAGAFPFVTRSVKAGEVLILYGVGFGATSPSVPAGQVFTGAAPLESRVVVTIGGINAPVSFGGLTGAGLYQFNVTVPAGLGAGDKALRAQLANGFATPVGPVVALQ
ncbi:MAG: peptidase fungalysin [Bryobacterales bacterium]|nr:peptidase fungalysin [Bryobacterales bacterium]